MLNTIKNAVLAVGYGVGLALFANDATMERIKKENAARREAQAKSLPPTKKPRWASMGTLHTFEATPTEARDYTALDPFQLRKECQQHGIKWRSAHGKNKHLRKGEMIERLMAVTGCRAIA